jgi:hypothetical protein
MRSFPLLPFSLFQRRWFLGGRPRKSTEKEQKLEKEQTEIVSLPSLTSPGVSDGRLNK